MKQHVNRLNSLSEKNRRRIIGLMSGTSLDGLDIALCLIERSGADTSLKLEQFKTVEYTDDIKQEIQQVFSKQSAGLEKICLLNDWLGRLHANMINETLNEWKISKDEIDLIASHGQTIYHAPLHQHKIAKYGNATLQIADGDHIAAGTGVITISDFRQKHIAAGGEGAPLAAYGDLILFGEKEKDIILLNIGGIANFTYLPARQSGRKMFSTDIGPGNTMMDAWMQKNFPGKFYDKDASVAIKGKVSNNLLHALMQHGFFSMPIPKTTGPELFSLSYLEKAIKKIAETLSVEDVMATLNRFTSVVICDEIRAIKDLKNNAVIYISGGGMHNPMILEYLKKDLVNISIRSTAEKNINPDAKEAILFAILANECVAGDLTTFNDHFPNVSMGKISFPG